MKKLMSFLIVIFLLGLLTSCEEDNLIVEPMVDVIGNIDEPTELYSEALVSKDGSFYLNGKLLYVEEYLLYNNVEKSGLKNAITYADTTYADTTYIYYVWDPSANDGLGENYEYDIDIDTINTSYVGWTIWMRYIIYYHDSEGKIIFEENIEVLWEIGDRPFEYIPDTIFYSSDNILERNYFLLEITGGNNEILNVFDYRIKRNPFDSVPLLSINIVSYNLITDTILDSINIDNLENYSIVWNHHFEREYIIKDATIMIEDFDYNDGNEINVRYVSLDVLAYEINNMYFRFNLVDELGFKSTNSTNGEIEDYYLFDIDYNDLSVGKLDYERFEYENMDDDVIKELYKFAIRNNLIKKTQGDIFGIFD